MRKTFNHEHMLTLDELPLLAEGNVAPNVRISEPVDGAELRGPRAVAGLRPSHGARPEVSQNAGDLTVGGTAGSETRAERADVQLSGFAADRNTNLHKVTIHALPAPWRNWFLRNDADVLDAFPDTTSLGEVRLGPDGRWTFTWQSAPAGVYNVVALARDAAGLVACSNVVRITVGVENLARGKKVTVSSTSKHGNPAEAAVDGDPNTMWWSDKDQPDPQWLSVDLDDEKTVGGVSVTWWKAYPKDYTVEVSDDSEMWRPVAKTENRRNYHGDMDVFRFEPVRTRYVRLHCRNPAVTWQAYTVFEFAVFAAVPE
jgi:hypothetical protein